MSTNYDAQDKYDSWFDRNCEKMLDYLDKAERAEDPDKALKYFDDAIKKAESFYETCLTKDSETGIYSPYADDAYIYVVDAKKAKEDYLDDEYDKRKDNFLRNLEEKKILSSIRNKILNSIDAPTPEAQFIKSFLPDEQSYVKRIIKDLIRENKLLKTKSSNKYFLEKYSAEQAAKLPPKPVPQSKNKPSERQLAYANDLGITIPNGASMEDVSHLIDCKKGIFKAPHPELIDFANNRNIQFPKYVSKEGLYNKIFSSLDDIDKVAFFAFSIYRWLSDDRRANLDVHPHMEELYDFASQWCVDEKFMKSLNTYQGEDLRFFGTIKSVKNGWESEYTAGSNKTFAYKTAANFLHEKFNTPLTKSKTFNDDIKNSANAEDIMKNIPPYLLEPMEPTPKTINTAKKSPGCLLPILLIIATGFLLIFL